MRRDGLLHNAFIMFLLAWGLTTEAWATDVTLRLVDQNGALIPASQIVILTPPGGTVQNGGTISLPDGAYTIRLFPGLNGSAQTGSLYRDESVSVSGGTQTLDFVWTTAPLQINLVDQNNVSIPASQFQIQIATNVIPDGSSVVLPVTNDPNTSPIGGTYGDGYVIALYPGLNGTLQAGQRLIRSEQLELTPGGTNKTFVWVTAPLQINLVDQNNVSIPATQFQIQIATNVIPDGSSVVLPVTNDPNTSPIGGTYGDGYVIALYPGLNGTLQAGQRLIRSEQLELTPGGTNKTFVWVTAPLQINLVDQNNVSIPASQFLVQVVTNVIADGSSVVLPVTEDPNTSPIGGTYGDGYVITLYPGLNGNLQSGQRLIRNENVELTATNFVYTFAWEISRGTLHVVDASENEVSGASIRQGVLFGTIKTGTCFSLPITDNTVYPSIGGQYANGYDDFYIQTAVANPFEGPFTFKFLSNKIINPAFVTLASGMHGLRFDLMTPTVLAAHAGSDQTVSPNQTVQIGGSPTASGGTGPYIYSWTPTAGLDDPHVANPNATMASTTTYTVEVTDAKGCKATDQVKITVQTPVTIKPYVFLANKITLKRDKQHTPAGDIHSNGSLTIEKGDPSTYNSNLTAVGNIVIQKDNTINGNVKSAAAITNQGKINGTKTIGAVNTESLPSKSYSAGGANKTVPKNGTLSLTPSAYGLVTMNSFGTLKLTSGDYYFNELRSSSTVTTAVIEIDLSSRNPVTINVVNNLQLGNEVAIRLLPNGEADSKLVTFFTLQNSAVTLGREAYWLGSFNAPNAKVTLDKNSQLRGAICAQELIVERDCLFLHHDSPGSLPGPGKLPKASEVEESEVSDQSPVTSYQLEQNYPNPFWSEAPSRLAGNPSTMITFALSEAGEVTLRIYSEIGQLVKQVASGKFASGRHQVNWDGRNESGQFVAAGLYLYQLLVTGENGKPLFSEARRMTLLK